MRAKGVSFILGLMVLAGCTGRDGDHIKKGGDEGGTSAPIPTVGAVSAPATSSGGSASSGGGSSTGGSAGGGGASGSGYSSNFDGATAPSGWQLSPPSSGVGWGFDGSPSTVSGGAYSSASKSLNYNNGTTYASLAASNSGYAESPPINISGFTTVALTFACNYDTEMIGASYDKRFVRISNDNFSTTLLDEQLATSGGSSGVGACAAMGTWHTHTLALQPSWGTIQVRFFFDTIDGYFNDYAGWFIDDVSVGTPSGGGASGGTTTTTSSVTSYPNGHPLSVDTTDGTILNVEQEIHQLVNNHRVSIGLNSLQMHEGIRKAARAHSQHMIVHDFFAHDNPEGDGPPDRLTKVGISWQAAGENIAAGYSTAQAAFTGWMNSPGHKANIENAIWTHTGIGYYAGGTYGKYYTQKFAKNPQ